MKKVFVLLVLCTMSFCTISANDYVTEPKTVQSKASILGSWVTDGLKYITDGSEDEKVFEKAELIFRFTPSSIIVTFDIQASFAEDDIKMQCGISIEGEGTYSKKKNDLSIDCTGAKPKIDLYKFKLDVDEETRAALAVMGANEDFFKNMLKEQMNQSGASEMYKAIEGKLKITELTSDTMVVVDEKGKALSFTRRK